MPFTQSIDKALAADIGAEGLPAEAFSLALKRSEAALDWLRARHADGGLPLLRLPAERADLDGITQAARRLVAGASDVVLLGTGGSSLGGQTLAQLSGHAVPGVGLLRDPPRMHFMDNLDPETFATLLARLPLSTTRFVAISKSGGTGETLMQSAAVLAALKQAGLEKRIGELMLGLSEPVSGGKRNGLRDLLEPFDVTVLEHDPGVGGRFSVLSNVGLLPAAMLGLDIGTIRNGAAVALAAVLERKAAADVPAAVGAAL